MSLFGHPELIRLLLGVLALLVGCSLVGFVLRARALSPEARATAVNFVARTYAWWIMAGLFALALLAGRLGPIILFALVSFLALREFLTLTPTTASDHCAMACTFFLVAPAQYALLAIHWYGLYSIMIPVYAFLLLPAVNVLQGDTARFLERTAAVQWALMASVYAISYAPALLDLTIPGYETPPVTLLVWFLIVVQGSDFLQYVFGKLVGRRKIAPLLSPSKTWEGFAAGIGAASLAGTALWWATPFGPWRAALMALIITLMGFLGGLTMSAIKRDRGVKDFGTLVSGHGGVLDRIDSLCFSAPVFFHLTRYFYSTT